MEVREPVSLDRIALLAWCFERRYGQRPTHVFLRGMEYHELRAEMARWSASGDPREIVPMKAQGLRIERGEKFGVALVMYEEEDDESKM